MKLDGILDSILGILHICACVSSIYIRLSTKIIASMFLDVEYNAWMGFPILEVKTRYKCMLKFERCDFDDLVPAVGEFGPFPGGVDKSGLYKDGDGWYKTEYYRLSKYRSTCSKFLSTSTKWSTIV